MASDVQLIVVLHENESRKKSNTGHLAKLVLRDCRIVLYPARGRVPVDLSLLDETHAPDGRPWRTALFFPGLGAQVLTQETAAALRAADARLRVVIPDGTWRQARRMVKRTPALARLPRIALPAPPNVLTRAALHPNGERDDIRVSALEAIAAAYGLLGESDAATALHSVYAAAVVRAGAKARRST